MRKYNRIKLEEREKIYILVQGGHSCTYIANKLSRHKSTISRELSRCRGDKLGYLPDRADVKASGQTGKNPNILGNTELSAHVIAHLNLGWSPEQIAGRLKASTSHLRISHETIYKFIYSAEGQEQKLFSLLVRRKPKRTKWHSRKPRKSHIPETANIKYRSSSIEKRKRMGHWEGDLVVSGALKNANITTLVERKSRYVKLLHNTDKYTKTVIGNIKKAMSGLPKKLRKSMTFDRGTEFASYRILDINTYFCDPHAPWQKGSNENFNGRLRRYFPKRFDTKSLSQDSLDNVATIMNNQPRKCLGYKTPAEVFANQKYRLLR